MCDSNEAANHRNGGEESDMRVNQMRRGFTRFYYEAGLAFGLEFWITHSKVHYIWVLPVMCNSLESDCAYDVVTEIRQGPKANTLDPAHICRV